MHVRNFLSLGGGGGQTVSLVSKPPCHPLTKYFQESQIQTVTSSFLFPITAFCPSPPPHSPTTPIKSYGFDKNSSQTIWSARGFTVFGKRRPSRQFSIYYARITILLIVFHHIFGSRGIYSSNNICDQE